MPTFALLGYPLSHSFSQRYFTEKFVGLGLSDTHRYINFELEHVIRFKEKLNEYSDLRGCNVTIPHKQAVVPLLDRLDPAAAGIGAVNTILIENGRTTGFNTDYLGFTGDLLEGMHAQSRSTDLAGQSALILGTGGASLAVKYALEQLGVHATYVSRTAGPGRSTYAGLDAEIMRTHRIIVNTTPLGMSPKVDAAPDLPYHYLTRHHFCYDLVYNPAETLFLRKARGGGAGTMNGLGMLYRQAEASWAIWNQQ